MLNFLSFWLISVVFVHIFRVFAQVVLFCLFCWKRVKIVDDSLIGFTYEYRGVSELFDPTFLAKIFWIQFFLKNGTKVSSFAQFV